MKCEECQKDVHKERKPLRKYFVDDRGKIWRGNTCPDCSLATERTPKSKEPTRFCRVCKKKLQTRFYFHHDTCIKGREGVYTSEEYGVQYHGW